MAGQKDFIGFKAADTLKNDIDRVCGGRCCRSAYVKQAVLKALAMDGMLTVVAATLTSGAGPYRTLNCIQLDAELENGIIIRYDETCSFPIPILVPFTENGKTLWRDQNGYGWEMDEGEELVPVYTDEGECKDIPLRAKH